MTTIPPGEAALVLERNSDAWLEIIRSAAYADDSMEDMSVWIDRDVLRVKVGNGTWSPPLTAIRHND